MNNAPLSALVYGVGPTPLFALKLAVQDRSNYKITMLKSSERSPPFPAIFGSSFLLRTHRLGEEWDSPRVVLFNWLALFQPELGVLI